MAFGTHMHLGARPGHKEDNFSFTVQVIIKYFIPVLASSAFIPKTFSGEINPEPSPKDIAQKEDNKQG